MNIANTIAMTQVAPNNFQTNVSSSKQENNSFMFHLSEQSVETTSQTDNHSNEQLILPLVNEEQVTNLLQLLAEIFDQLPSVESLLENSEQLENGYQINIGELYTISIVNENIILNDHLVKLLSDNNDTILQQLNSNSSYHLLTENNISQFDLYSEHKQINFVDQMQQLTEKINSMLSNLKDGDLQQISAKLLPILKQLSQMMNDDNETKVLKQLNEQLSADETDLITRLLASFQKRTDSAISNAYRHEAEVTTDDISRWLTEALNNQNVTIEQSFTTPVRTGSEQMTMSPIEQYVIHLNESDRIERVQDQLVRQLETVVKQSRFLKSPEVTQLSFTLNPNHLGNVHVQLVEIHGEMTVKMIASSLAAKKMLEANIHQLKHLFAPHNIVIERNDTEIDEVEHTDEQLDEENEEQAMQEEQQSGNNESQNEENEIQFDSFQSILNELNNLVNR